MIWLAIITLFVAIASTMGARLDQVDSANGSVNELIAASEAHARALQEGGNAAAAERWNRLSAATR